MSEWCERCEAHPVRPLRSHCALNTSVRARGGQTPARNKGKWFRQVVRTLPSLLHASASCSVYPKHPRALLLRQSDRRVNQRHGA